MSIKPLVVYLDSSDISLLSNPHTRTNELISIESSLFDLQTKGLIEFRFSQIHIIEAAPKDEFSVEFARERLNYIHKLCNKKCLVSYVDILEHEVLRLSESYEDKEIEFYNDESKWYPKLETSDSINLKSICEEIIKEQPDRKKKRILKRKLFTNVGEVRKEVISGYNYLSPVFIKEIMDKYPITQEEATSCIDALFKGTSENQLYEILEKSFSEINRLPQWYELHWDRIIPISSYLRDIGFSLRSSTERLYLESRAVYESYVLQGLDEKDINRKIKDIFSSGKDTLKNGLVVKMAEQMDLKIDPEKLSWSTTPSVLTATSTCYQIAHKCIYLGGASRTFKASDFGDISHTFHLPHVDIFRADAFIASVLKDVNLPFNTSIVGNLNNLLDVIDNRLTVS